MKVEFHVSRKQRTDDYRTFQITDNINPAVSNNDNMTVVKRDNIEYIEPTSSNQTEEPGKVKYTYIADDDMPFQYRNVRPGNVEFIFNLSGNSQLKSTLHIPQAERPIVEITNIVFGRTNLGHEKYLNLINYTMRTIGQHLPTLLG